MRRITSLLLSLVGGAVLLLAGAVVGDALADDGGVEVAGPASSGDPVLTPLEPAPSVSPPPEGADAGDVELADLPTGNGATVRTVAVGPVSVDDERARMRDPERLAEVAERGADPYEPPDPDDAVPEAEVRAASAESPDGDEDPGIIPLGGDDGTTVRFFDLCAGESAEEPAEDAEGCPEEGVGGTVLLAIEEPPPFDFYYSNLDMPSFATRCPIVPIDPDRETVLWHTTNRPADRVRVMVEDNRHLPEGATRWRETVDSFPAPGEVELYEARGPEVDTRTDPRNQVQYCTTIRVPDPDMHSLHIRITYEVDGRTYESGFISSFGRPGSDLDRPGLTLSPLGDHALATLTHTRDERVYLAAVPRTGEGASQDRCADIRQAVIDRTYRGPGILGTPRLILLDEPYRPALYDDLEFTHRTTVGVWPEEGVTYTLCAWYVGEDEFGVVDVVEENELQFTAPNRSRIRVLLTGITSSVDLDAGHLELSPRWPGSPSVSLPLEDMEAGDGPVFLDPPVLFDSGVLDIPAQTIFDVRQPDHATVRIATPTNLCPPAPRGGDEREVLCVGGYHKDETIEIRKDGEPVGRVHLRVEAYDGPGAEFRQIGDDRDWSIGRTASGNPRPGDPAVIHFGRGTEVTLDPADPTVGLVTLVADREILVDDVHLDVLAFDEGGCDSTSISAAVPAREHTFRFEGLCRGTAYRVEYTVREPGGEPQSSAFGYVRTPGYKIEWFQPFVELTPEPGVRMTSLNEVTVVFNGMTAPFGAPYCRPAGEWSGREAQGWTLLRPVESLELPRLVPVGVVVRPIAEARDCDEARPRAVAFFFVEAADLLAGDVTVSVPVDGWGTLDVRLKVSTEPLGMQP